MAALTLRRNASQQPTIEIWPGPLMVSDAGFLCTGNALSWFSAELRRELLALPDCRGCLNRVESSTAKRISSRNDLKNILTHPCRGGLNKKNPRSLRASKPTPIDALVV